MVNGVAWLRHRELDARRLSASSGVAERRDRGLADDDREPSPSAIVMTCQVTGDRDALVRFVLGFADPPETRAARCSSERVVERSDLLRRRAELLAERSALCLSNAVIVAFVSRRTLPSSSVKPSGGTIAYDAVA